MRTPFDQQPKVFVVSKTTVFLELPTRRIGSNGPRSTVRDGNWPSLSCWQHPPTFLPFDRHFTSARTRRPFSSRRRAVLSGLPERRLPGLEDRKQPLVHSFAGRQLPPHLLPFDKLLYIRSMNAEAIMEWEPVLTVHDYFDGPRNGIAIYRGQAHAYKCEWDDALDDWDRVFLLSPIDDGQLSAVKEDWLIWRRYQNRFASGTLQAGDRHPALSADWPRHEQLAEVVEQALLVRRAIAIRAIPEFRGTIEPNHDFEARWLTV